MSRADMLTELETLLDEERDALRAGRIEMLDDLGARRDAIVGELRATRRDAAQVSRIQEKLRRNAMLLTACGNGVRAAIRRVRELHEAAGPISSYGPNGTAQAIGHAAPSLERKA